MSEIKIQIGEYHIIANALNKEIREREGVEYDYFDLKFEVSGAAARDQIIECLPGPIKYELDSGDEGDLWARQYSYRFTDGEGSPQPFYFTISVSENEADAMIMHFPWQQMYASTITVAANRARLSLLKDFLLEKMGIDDNEFQAFLDDRYDERLQESLETQWELSGMPGDPPDFSADEIDES